MMMNKLCVAAAATPVPLPIFASKSMLTFSLNWGLRRRNHLSSVSIKAVESTEPKTETEKEKATETKTSKQTPKKPVYSMKKGQIVRVDKDKYLNSVNYLSVGHPPYYKGLDYIYEDRGEVLDLRIFETGEHALVSWVGVPTAPAWLPTDMLIKSEKLDYERL